MAFGAYQDKFKHSVDESVGGNFEYEIGNISGSGSVSPNHPVTNAMSRNLGDFMRFSADTMAITFESINALTASDTHLMPTCVGILGHNLTAPAVVTVVWTFRTGTPTTVTRSHILFSDKSDNFNNEFFMIRDRHDDVPYKVQIAIYNNNSPDADDFIDIGRLMFSPLWDLDDPRNNDPGLILAGWETGFIEGAKSKLTRGNQSYSNRLDPLKTLDFELATTNVTDDQNWLEMLGDDGTGGGFSLDEKPSIMGFNRHLQKGGAAIIVPRDLNDTGSPHSLDKVLKSRLGIYGESAKSANSTPNDGESRFNGKFKLRQIQ